METKVQYKQAIIVLPQNMTAGKIAAQCGHAALSTILTPNNTHFDKSQYLCNAVLVDEDIINWYNDGQSKVTLLAATLSQMLNIYEVAKALGIKCAIIRDAGLTQVEEGTITAVTIGPGKASEINKLTGRLKLL